MKRADFLTVSLVALVIAGCGGGSEEGSDTRAQIQRIDQALGSRTQFDPGSMLADGRLSHGSVADSISGFAGSNGLPAPGFGSNVYSHARKLIGIDRAGDSVYFDGYLKLWVKKTQTETETARELRYDFYADATLANNVGLFTSTQPKENYPVEDVRPDVALTIPASEQPAYPILFKTFYYFTAGTLINSKGWSVNQVNADRSFDSKYQNEYSDGWRERGNNHRDSTGSTWFARLETPEGKYAEVSGSFQGSIGKSRMESSDGYKAEYQFTHTESGHGKIEGNAPDLPVTISWDGTGNVVVRYANGAGDSFQRR